jgi:hypothetical protein
MTFTDIEDEWDDEDEEEDEEGEDQEDRTCAPIPLLSLRSSSNLVVQIGGPKSPTSSRILAGGRRLIANQSLRNEPRSRCSVHRNLDGQKARHILVTPFRPAPASSNPWATRLAWVSGRDRGVTYEV